MKKTIASLLVFLLMFNFIFANSSYVIGKQADGDEESDSPYAAQIDTNTTVASDLVESGETTSQDGATKSALTFGSVGTSIIGFVTGIISTLLDVLIALQIDVIMSDLTASTEVDSDRK